MSNKKISDMEMCVTTVLPLENFTNLETLDPKSEKKLLKASLRRAYLQQFISVFSGYILMVVDGTCTTWTSPALPYLRSKDSGFSLTVTEEAMIVSISSMTGMIGYLLLPLLSNRFGRKYSILVYGLLLLLSLIIIQFASSFLSLFAGRMVLGVGAAGIYGLLPLYIGETVHENVRGSFLTFDKMCVNVGAFLMTVAGAFLSYKTMNLVMILGPLIGILLFPLTLETPYYYLMKGKEKEAISIKMKLSGTDRIEDVIEDIERMKTAIVEGQKSEKSSFKDLFLDRGSRKALIIKLLTSATYSFSGYGIVQAYAQDLFKSSGSTLAPEHCVMIMTGIQIFAGLPSSQIVDLWGRRPTFLLSGSLSSLSLIILGGFFFLKSCTTVDVASFSWVPMVTLVSFSFFCNMGLTTIPYLYMGELFSIKVKGVATTVSLILEALFSFSSKLILPFVSQSVGLYASFWIYAALCLSASISVFLIAPETKGKNLEEVLEMLKVKEKKENVKK